MSRKLNNEEITRQLADLPNWTRPDATDEIHGRFEFEDFVAALAFVNAVGQAAEEMQHHPDIDIRWNKVRLVLSTHSEGGLTQLDVELAHQIDALAKA